MIVSLLRKFWFPLVISPSRSVQPEPRLQELWAFVVPMISAAHSWSASPTWSLLSMVPFFLGLSTEPTSKSPKMRVKIRSATVSSSFEIQLTCQCFMFGYLNDQVQQVRYNNSYNPLPLDQRSPELATVFKHIESGAFGDSSIYDSLLKTVSLRFKD